VGLWYALYQAGYCYIREEKNLDPALLSEEELFSLFENAYKEAKDKAGKNSLAIFGSRGTPEKKLKEAFKDFHTKRTKGIGLFCEICGKEPAYEVDFLWGKKDLSGSESAFRVCPYHLAIIYIGAVRAIGDGEFIKIFGSRSDSYAWFVIPEVVGEGDVCKKWQNSFNIKEEGVEAPSEEQNDGDMAVLMRRLGLNMEEQKKDRTYLVWTIGVMKYNRQNARSVYTLIPGVDTHYLRRLNEIGGGTNLRVLTDWRILLKKYQKIAFSDGKGDWWVRMYIDTATSLLSRSFLSIPLISMIADDVAWSMFKREVLQERGGKNDYTVGDIGRLWDFLKFTADYYKQILQVDEYSWNGLMSLYFLGRAMGHYDDMAVKKNRPPKMGRLLLSYHHGVDHLIEDTLLKRLSAMSMTGEDVDKIVEALVSVNLNVSSNYKSLMRAFLWIGYLHGRKYGLSEEVKENRLFPLTYRGYILGKLLRGDGETPLPVSRDVLRKIFSSDKIEHSDILRWLLKASYSYDVEKFLYFIKKMGYISENNLKDMRFLTGLMLGLMGIEKVSPYSNVEPEKIDYPASSLSAKVGYVWGRRVKEGFPMGSFRYGVSLLSGQKELLDVMGSIQMQYYIRQIWGENEVWRIRYTSGGETLNVNDLYGGFVRAVVEDE